MRKMLR